MRRWVVTAVVVGGLFTVGAAGAAQEPTDPVVHAVLFFSPTCPHCEFVISQVLPPVFEEHGGPWSVQFDESLLESGVSFYMLDNGTLRFLLVDVTVETGFRFFDATTSQLAIDSGAVPRLIIANQVMIGSVDIPERLPAVVTGGLEAGGIEWPDLPGIGEVVAWFSDGAAGQAAPGPEDSAAETAPATTGEAPATTVGASGAAAVSGLPVPHATLGERFGRDVLANTVAVIVLVGLVVSLWLIPVAARRTWPGGSIDRAVPVLGLAGAAIAGYLTYIETTGNDAVCGPVGDCNTVQQSSYAQVAGVPIGVVGLIGYLLVLVAWLVRRTSQDRRSDVAAVLIFIGAVVGVTFSAYLTFLEPFVIGATCVWCLASAIIVAALLWASIGSGVEAWRRLRPAGSQPEQFPAQLVR